MTLCKNCGRDMPKIESHKIADRCYYCEAVE